MYVSVLQAVNPYTGYNSNSELTSYNPRPKRTTRNTATREPAPIQDHRQDEKKTEDKGKTHKTRRPAHNVEV